MRLLADFADTGDLQAIGEARRRIQAISKAQFAIAIPLWELSLNLQRTKLDHTGDAA